MRVLWLLLLARAGAQPSGSGGSGGPSGGSGGPSGGSSSGGAACAEDGSSATYAETLGSSNGVATRRIATTGCPIPMR